MAADGSCGQVTRACYAGTDTTRQRGRAQTRNLPRSSRARCTAEFAAPRAAIYETSLDERAKDTGAAHTPEEIEVGRQQIDELLREGIGHREYGAALPENCPAGGR